MSEQNTNNDEVDGVKIFKWEYNNFLEFVKEHKVEHAMIYAQTLGIDRRTLVHWMSQPELIKALVAALDELVAGMKRAGSKDWRMYRELLNMLGVKDIKEVDLKSGGEVIKGATIVFENPDTPKDSSPAVS